MTHTIHKVAEFHSKFGHPIANKLTEGTKELRELRVKLIAEELCELCEALNVNLQIDIEEGVFDVTVNANDGEVNMVEAADALGDLDYVVQGANLVFGIPSEAVLDEIHRSNMSKLGEDGKPIYREDGKILKGPNYTLPDIGKVLASHVDGLYDLNSGAASRPSIDEETGKLIQAAYTALKFMWQGPDMPTILTPQDAAKIESQIRDLNVPRILHDLQLRTANETAMLVPFDDIVLQILPKSGRDGLQDAAELMADASEAVFGHIASCPSVDAKKVLRDLGSVYIGMRKVLQMFQWTVDDVTLAKRVDFDKHARDHIQPAEQMPPTNVVIKPA